MVVVSRSSPLVARLPPPTPNRETRTPQRPRGWSWEPFMTVSFDTAEAWRRRNGGVRISRRNHLSDGAPERKGLEHTLLVFGGGIRGGDDLGAGPRSDRRTHLPRRSDHACGVGGPVQA